MSTLAWQALLVWLSGTLVFLGIYLVWQDQWYIKDENIVVFVLRRLAVLSCSWVGVGMALGRIGWDTAQLKVAHYRQSPPCRVLVPAGQLIAIWVDGAWKTECDQRCDRLYIVPLQSSEGQPPYLPDYTHIAITDGECRSYGYYALYTRNHA